MFAGLLVALGIPWLHSGDSRQVVLVFGDSLTVQSEDAARQFAPSLNERVVFEAEGGSAMCDWVRRAPLELAKRHPVRVVLAFTGNTASCVSKAYLKSGARGAVSVYEESLRQMRTIFARVPITLVVPPAMRNLPHGWFPFNGNAALVAMYKQVGAELHMTVDTSADDWLTPHHIYRQARSAFPYGPVTDVRLTDGVHLTPAGELWYAAALLGIKLPTDLQSSPG